jgi:hypothetical protein
VTDWNAGIDYAILRGALIRIEMERDQEELDDVDPSRAQGFFKKASASFKSRWSTILKDHVAYEKKAVDTLLSKTKDAPSNEAEMFGDDEKARSTYEAAVEALRGDVADRVASLWSDVIHCSYGHNKEDESAPSIQQHIRDAWVRHVDTTLGFAKSMVLFHENSSVAKHAEEALYKDGNNLGKVLNHYTYLDMGLSAPKPRIEAMHEELFH